MWKQTLIAIAAMLFSTSCCQACFLLIDNGGDSGSSGPGPTPDDPNYEPPKPGLDPTPKPGDINLGVGVYPPSPTPSKPVVHRFIAKPLKPSAYLAGYALSPAEDKVLRDSFRSWAKSVGYRQVDENRFTWDPPPGCERDMHCVLEAVSARDAPDLAPLAALFQTRVKTAKLSALQAAELIIAFVQGIQYEIPKEPFGLMPPALVVAEKRGDCDSKSLLALILLKAVGVDSVLIESEAHEHAMLGVALPAQGSTFDYNGRRYAFTECTAVGWPIGQMDPRLKSPNDWKPVPVRIGSTPVAPAPKPAPAPAPKPAPAPRPAPPRPVQPHR